MILVDTSIWSFAVRRHEDALAHQARARLRDLAAKGAMVCIPGIALQELLSKLRDTAQLQRVRRGMERVPVLLATDEDHQLAADFATQCRWRGVQTSLPDCLIAAQAIHRDAELLSHDRDFGHMLPACPGLRLLTL